MIPPPRSLAHTLTVRLILLQVGTLLALAICMPLLQVVTGQSLMNAPDGRTGRIIASSMHLVDGVLMMQPTDEFTELVRGSPNLWFVAGGGEGMHIEYGVVPATMISVARSVELFEAVDFVDRGEGSRNASFAVKPTADGDMRIVFGNGPVMGPARALVRSAAELAMPLASVLVLLVSVTALLIPSVIGSSLRGIRRVVDHARQIDIDRRGTRLPTAGVPAEIVALVGAMNDALGRIDDGYLRQQRFLADAAHELRTPIAILQNRIELLVRGDLDLPRPGDRLLLDVRRVANLAEQLLDLQRIDWGDKPFGSVDLAGVAKNVVADLAPMAIEAGYDVQVNVRRGPAEVSGDASAIERAVINLVQNAIAHGGNRGSIAVEVDRNAITVSDDGDGIPRDQRALIFEPFHRLKPKNQGAGLGLSMVREIMQRHRGSIVAGASASGGASFQLRFWEPS